MGWYEVRKKHLDEIYEMIQSGHKSNRKMDVILLAMVITTLLCFAMLSVINFCKGDWYIVIGVWYVLLSILNGCLGIECVRRIRDTRGKLKANEMWYEVELNRLNNLKKESEDETDKTDRELGV